MLEFWCKLVNLTKSYRRKQKGMFFLNTVEARLYHERCSVAGGLWRCVPLNLCRRQHVSYVTSWTSVLHAWWATRWLVNNWLSCDDDQLRKKTSFTSLVSKVAGVVEFGLAINRLRVQILLEVTLRNNLGQVVDTYVPRSPSSIIWYWPKGGDALRLGR